MERQITCGEEPLNEIIEVNVAVPRHKGLENIAIRSNDNGKGAVISEFLGLNFSHELLLLYVNDIIIAIDDVEIESDIDYFRLLHNFSNPLVNDPYLRVKVSRKMVKADNTIRTGEKLTVLKRKLLAVKESDRETKNLEIVELSFQISEFYVSIGEYTRARRRIQQVLDILSELENKDMELLKAGCCFLQSQIEFAEKNLAECQSKLHQSFTEYITLGESELLNQYKTLSKLASFCEFYAKNENHVLYRKQAREIMDQLLLRYEKFTDPTMVADMYLNLAKVEYDNGHLENAMKFYDICFKLVDKLGNSSRVYGGFALVGIIDILLFEKKLEFARRKLEILLNIRTEFYPKRSLEYGEVLLLQARLSIMEESNLTQSYTNMLDVIDIRKAVYGNQHVLLAESYLIMGEILRLKKEFTKANFYYWCGLYIFRKNHTDNFYTTVSLLGSIQLCYRQEYKFLLNECSNTIPEITKKMESYFDVSRFSNSGSLYPMSLQWIPQQYLSQCAGIKTGDSGEVAEEEAQTMQASGFSQLDNSVSLPEQIIGAAPVSAKVNISLSKNRIQKGAEFMMQHAQSIINKYLKYQDAKILYQQAHTILSDSLGSNHPDVLNASLFVANTHNTLGEYATADEIYNNIVNAYVQNVNYKNSAIGMAGALVSWGENQLLLGNHRSAKEKFFECSRIYREEAVKSSIAIDMFPSEYGLARCLYYDANYVDSVKALNKLIQKVKNLGDANAPNSEMRIADLQLYLCKNNIQTNNFVEARNLLDQTLSTRKNLFGDNHIQYSYAEIVDAKYHYILGDYNGARDRYERCAKKSKEIFGFEHPFTLQVDFEMAEMLLTLGDVEASFAEHTRILKSREKILVAYHVAIADSMLAVANCMRIQGKHNENDSFYESSCATFARKYGDVHPRVADSYFGRAENARDHGHIEKAKSYIDLAFQTRRELLGKVNIATLDCLYIKIEFELVTPSSKKEELIAELRKLQKEYKKLLGEDHYIIGKLMHTEGIVFMNQMRYHDANKVLQEAFKIVSGVLGAKHYHTIAISNDLYAVSPFLMDGNVGSCVETMHGDKHIEGSSTVSNSLSYDSGKVIGLDDEYAKIPKFDNSVYCQSISDLNTSIETLSVIFPSNDQINEHPSIICCIGNIGVIEQLEAMEKKLYLNRLTPHQRAKIKEFEERELIEKLAKLTTDFDDSAPGSLKLRKAVDYFTLNRYNSTHLSFSKFSKSLKSSLATSNDEEKSSIHVLAMRVSKKMTLAKELLDLQEYHKALEEYSSAKLMMSPDPDGPYPDDAVMYSMSGECYFGLATLYKALNQFDLAKENYNKTMDVCLSTNLPQNHFFATVLYEKVDLLTILNEYDEASQLIDDVIHLKTQILGHRHHELFQLYYQKCVIKLELGEYEEAMKMAHNLLDERMETLKGGDTHELIPVGNVYITIAEIELRLGLLDKCEKAISVALKTFREVIPTGDHMSIADCYHLKGLLRLEERRYSEALKSFSFSLAMKRRLLFFMSGDIKSDSSYQRQLSRQESNLPESLEDSSDVGGIKHYKISTSLIGQAESLRRDGKYSFALDLYEKAASINSAIFYGCAPNHKLVAAVKFGIAQHKQDLGIFFEASSLFNESIEMLESVYIKKHPDIFEYIMGLISNQISLSIFDEAMTKCEMVLNNRIEMFGMKHYKVAETYVVMGDLYRILGHHIKADESYYSAKNIYRLTVEENHINLCKMNYGLAENFYVQGKYAEAAVLYKFALAVITLAYGDSYPDIGTYSAAYSRALFHLGDYSESKIEANRAIRTHNKIYGANHPLTMLSLLQLGKLLIIETKFQDGLLYIERSLDFTKKIFEGQENRHVEVSDCLYECGCTYIIFADYLKAWNAFNSAIDIRRRLLGSDHIETLRAISALADTERRLGKLSDAERVHDECMTAGLKAQNGLETPFLALTLFRLGQTLRYRGKTKKAFLLFERCLGIRIRCYRGDHDIVAETYHELGVLSLQLGNYRNAQVYFQKEININRKVFIESHPLIAKSLYGSALCLTALGYYASARKLYFEAINMFVSSFGRKHSDTIEMVCSLATNLRLEGKIYIINSYDVPSYDAESKLLMVKQNKTTNSSHDESSVVEDEVEYCLEIVEDFTNECFERNDLMAYALNVKTYHLLLNMYGDTHYLVLNAKQTIGDCLVAIGQFESALLLEKEMLSEWKSFYGQEYQCMALCVTRLAMIYLAMGKIKPVKPVLKENRNSLILSSIISAMSANSSNKTLTSPGKLPPVSLSHLSIAKGVNNINKAPKRKKVKGFMGYQYPDIKKKELDPEKNPMDHVTLKILENELRHDQINKSSIKISSKDKKMENESMSVRSSDCIWLFALAIELQQLLYPPDGGHHPLTAMILHGQANVQKILRNFEESIALNKKCLSVRQYILNSGHPLLSETLFHLAETYRMMNKYSDAKPLYDHVYEMRLQRNNEENEMTSILSQMQNVAIAESKLGMGLLLYDSGNFYDSLIPIEESLVIQSAVNGSCHFQVAHLQHALANVYMALSDFNKAVPLFEKALETKLRVYGPIHIEVAACRSNYALLLKAQGQYNDSMKLFEKVAHSQFEIYGANHPDVASTLNNIGAVLFAQGKFEESLTYYKESLTMKRNFFGDDHPIVASSIHNLAGVYQSMQEYSQAKSLYEEALAIRQSLYDYFHPSIADTLNNIGILYFSCGQYDEAEYTYTRTLEIKKRVYGEKHLAFASSLHNMATLLHARNRYNESRALYMQCLDVRMTELGPNHPDTIVCQENLNALNIHQMNDTKQEFEESFEDKSSNMFEY